MYLAMYNFHVCQLGRSNIRPSYFVLKSSYSYTLIFYLHVLVDTITIYSDCIH